MSDRTWFLIATPILSLMIGFFWTIGRSLAVDFYTTQATKRLNKNRD